MTVYNVGGTIRLVDVTEEGAVNRLYAKARDAEMDADDVEVAPFESGPFRGFVASGTVTGLFEAASGEVAVGRFMNWVLCHAGVLPEGVDAFESEPVPQEWVL